jgi:signal transduction histidine kinase
LFENAAISLWEEDISALQAYLEELRQRGVTNFRRYFQEHPEAVQRCFELVQVTNVNQAALEMYHVLNKEALLGQLNTLVFEAEPAHILTDQLVAMAEGRSRFSTEAVLSTFSGAKIYTDLSWSVAPNVNGLAQKIIVCLRDVTEHKRLQQQFLQAQKMEAVGQLAGGIAHNFNNMLTAIMGYLGLALEALPADHPIVADLEHVQATAKRAAALIHQLLIFSRRQPAEPKPLNLNQLIGTVKPLLRPLIPANIDLSLSLDPALGLVKIDANQFEQVLMNLTLNARDAMPQGGKLIIKTANLIIPQPDTLLHSEVAPGDYVLISVTDTGIGMTEEIKSHLFEPFFTTKELGKGTGLGLATCYGIVKQSKGQIWVESEPDQGTTFNIYLPRFEPAAELADYH